MEIFNTDINFYNHKNKKERNTSDYFIYMLCILIIIAFSACTKSDSPELFQTYNKVKLLPDSAASPTSAFERIAAGDNRFFMTYSHENQHINFMVTDKEGNFLKHDALAPDQYLHGLLALNDGNFLICATPNSSSYGHFYHFNRDGENIGVDSIPFNIHGISGVANSHNGNIIACASNDVANILECDVHGNIIWSRKTELIFSFGTRTNDGGYLFFYSQGETFMVLLKTNSVGDSLWQKTINAPFNFECRYVTQMGNGNYRLSLSNLDSWNNASIGNAMSYVYEVNASGEFVKSTEINTTHHNYLGAMFQKDEEHTIVFVTTFFNVFGFGVPTIATHINTHYILLGVDMKIKESGILQSYSSDLFDAMCKTPEGKIACFGLIQSVQSTRFKPGLIILN